VIVQQGLVLGVEAIEGTDALLKAVRHLAARRAWRGAHQDREAGSGTPCRSATIGLRTVELAAETGLLGIAVEAEATIILDRQQVIRAADRAGLFVVGVRRS